MDPVALPLRRRGTRTVKSSGHHLAVPIVMLHVFAVRAATRAENCSCIQPPGAVERLMSAAAILIGRYARLQDHTASVPLHRSMLLLWTYPRT